MTSIQDKNDTEAHISFEEMSQYIFADPKSVGRKEFLSAALRINRHVMECPRCAEVYSALKALQESFEAYEGLEAAQKRRFFRICQALIRLGRAGADEIAGEVSKFRDWASFQVENTREIVKTMTGGFTYPRLVSQMQSADGTSEEVESIIHTSISDGNMNRVSVGLDGSLSLYFNAGQHPFGKRVVLLPEDENAEPRAAVIANYDDATGYARFRDVPAGEYEIVVEE